jgi:hypothetical protein
MFTKSGLCAAAVIAASLALISPAAMAQQTAPAAKPQEAAPAKAQETSAVAQQHKTAADQFEKAARHHREAAKAFEERKMGRAAIHAHMANGYAMRAHRNAEDAAMVSASNSESAWKFWDAEADHE